MWWKVVATPAALGSASMRFACVAIWSAVPSWLPSAAALRSASGMRVPQQEGKLRRDLEVVQLEGLALGGLRQLGDHDERGRSEERVEDRLGDVGGRMRLGQAVEPHEARDLGVGQGTAVRLAAERLDRVGETGRGSRVAGDELGLAGGVAQDLGGNLLGCGQVAVPGDIGEAAGGVVGDEVHDVGPGRDAEQLIDHGRVLEPCQPRNLTRYRYAGRARRYHQPTTGAARPDRAGRSGRARDSGKPVDPELPELPAPALPVQPARPANSKTKRLLRMECVSCISSCPSAGGTAILAGCGRLTTGTYGRNPRRSALQMPPLTDTGSHYLWCFGREVVPRAPQAPQANTSGRR